MKKYSLRTSGPCPTCGNTFESRGHKTFCSMSCYTQSPQFRAMLEQQHKKTGSDEICKECGGTFYKKKASKRFYCNSVCYRKYMAKRFDRWIASPEKLALPQNYDEFLTSHELPCLVEGCSWHGNFLSLHMNFTHGVPVRDFKKMAGFNLTSGIISLPLYELMCARPHIKKAKFVGGGNRSGIQGDGYKSLEGKEHIKKSWIINSTTGGILATRKCLECGRDAPVSFGEYAKKFCSVSCREKYYKSHGKERVSLKLSCCVCSNEFDASPDQARRNKKGMVSVCSLSCRQKLNAPKGVGSHSTWRTVKRKGESDGNSIRL
jgi:hypothetical protein